MYGIFTCISLILVVNVGKYYIYMNTYDTSFFEIKIHELHRTMSDQLVWEELDVILLSFVGDYRAPISQVFQ